MATFLIYCPMASSSELAIESLNLHFRDNPGETPVQSIQITHHGVQNSTAIVTTQLTKKVKHILNLLETNETLKIVYRYLNGKPFIIWSLHHPDHIPKKIELILSK